jgi:CubicO group peptidase (beta-lactamase class C family)
VADQQPPALTRDVVSSALRYADTWLALRRRQLRLPGVQTAAWYDDAQVLGSAHGLADVEAGVPLTNEHLFRAASHSKTFTATAVLQLRDAGRLRLDDRVGDWLTAVDAGGPVAGRTLADLLAHAGGVVRDGDRADHWQLSRTFPDVPELLALCGPGSAVLPAQARFKYSNLGYAVLGLVVAAVAGEPYNAHVTREIVQRLGLRRTGPDLDRSRSRRYATAYTGLSYADQRIPVEQVQTRALSPAAGFSSTAAELCRFASAHFLGDPRLLSDEAKRRMQHEQWEDGAGGAYGLGLVVSRVGARRLVGHGGAYPGHNTCTLLDPVARLAVSVCVNALDGPATELATAVVRLVDLAAAQAVSPSDGDAVTRARFCGRYASLWGVLDVADLGGRLVALDPTRPDPTTYPTQLRIEDDRTLGIVSASGYAAVAEKLEFVFGGAAGVRSLRGNGGVTYLPLHEQRQRLAGLDRVSASDAS